MSHTRNRPRVTFNKKYTLVLSILLIMSWKKISERMTILKRRTKKSFVEKRLSALIDCSFAT